MYGSLRRTISSQDGTSQYAHTRLVNLNAIFESEDAEKQWLLPPSSSHRSLPQLSCNNKVIDDEREGAGK